MTTLFENQNLTLVSSALLCYVPLITILMFVNGSVLQRKNIKWPIWILMYAVLFGLTLILLRTNPVKFTNVLMGYSTVPTIFLVAKFLMARMGRSVKSEGA